jgi:hypothetical protein
MTCAAAEPKGCLRRNQQAPVLRLDGLLDNLLRGPIMYFQKLIRIMVYSQKEGVTPFEKRRDHATTIHHLE